MIWKYQFMCGEPNVKFMFLVTCGQRPKDSILS
jgi:hypothetical protein